MQVSFSCIFFAFPCVCVRARVYPLLSCSRSDGLIVGIPGFILGIQCPLITRKKEERETFEKQLFFMNLLKKCHFYSPSIFEMCFSTFLAQPLQCILDTLSITVCTVHDQQHGNLRSSSSLSLSGKRKLREKNLTLGFN